jgi:DNA-binding PadR family transcriptional regulator
MQEASFLILTALAGGSQHGYGIMTEVAQISGGRVKLQAGTLYAALDRLTGDGLIELDREEIVDNRLRRYYRITGAGAERLGEEAGRLHANAREALTRLRPGTAMS